MSIIREDHLEEVLNTEVPITISNQDELIQYYIVNSELGMSIGKIAGQVAHVATNIVENIFAYKAWEYDAYQLYKQWKLDYDQKKIILRGKTKDLQKLVDLGFPYIRDLGLTEVPEGSLTCVGLGVMWKSEAQQYIKRLQLL